jgi:uncharacterized membrane protein YgcG
MSDDEQERGGEQRARVGGGGAGSGVRLPQFWPHAPTAWFVQAEAIFVVKNVTRSFDKYCHLLAGLPEESLRLVLDIAEQPPADDPYEALKERLLSSHQLSDFQRLEKLFDMPDLGAQKPSAMMAAMLEVCPRGEEKSKLFSGLFLRRLPREMRILLAHEDLTDLKLLAARADALHTHHHRGVVAALEDSEDGAVAAIRSQRGGRMGGAAGGGGGSNRGGQRRGGRGGNGSGNGGGRAAEPEAIKQARQAAGICYAHWRYGQNAYRCEQPCAWQGNGTAGAN